MLQVRQRTEKAIPRFQFQ